MIWFSCLDYLPQPEVVSWQGRAARSSSWLMMQVYCEMLPCTQKIKDLAWKPKGTFSACSRPQILDSWTRTSKAKQYRDPELRG